MNLIPSDGISVLTVFLQGLLSFFSPCVLPLLPVYIGYLSGGLPKDHPDNLSEISEDRANLESPGNNETNRSCESAETTKSTDNSKKPFGRKQILIHTLCFVLGIGFAFFTLGLRPSCRRAFFQRKQTDLCGSRRHSGDPSRMLANSLAPGRIAFCPFSPRRQRAAPADPL